MKNAFKIGCLAVIAGLFAVACNSGSSTGASSDSTNMSSDTSMMSTPAPATTDTGMMNMDSSKTDTTHHM